METEAIKNKVRLLYMWDRIFTSLSSQSFVISFPLVCLSVSKEKVDWKKHLFHLAEPGKRQAFGPAGQQVNALWVGIRIIYCPNFFNNG